MKKFIFPVFVLGIAVSLAACTGVNTKEETLQQTEESFAKRTISYDEALLLLKGYVKDESRVKHSIGVSAVAFNVANQIKDKHPELQIDPEEVRIGGLLHDIGYAGGVDGHELNSVDILKQENLGNIAEMVLHSYVYEQHFLKGIDERSYLPTSLENKIIIYSDFTYGQDEKTVTMKDRIAEIRERKKSEVERMKALDKAETRLYAIEWEILNLMK